MRSLPRPVPVFLAVLSAATAIPATSSRAQEVSPVEVVIEGKGYGHGVGMSQEGAYAMGLAGASAEDILARFYPGTSLGQRSGTVSVHLLERPLPSVVVRFPSGGEVRAGGAEQPSGFPVTVNQGGSVRLSYNGRYTVSPLDGARPADIAQPTGAGASPGGSAAPTAPGSTTTTTIPTLLGLIPLAPTPPPAAAPPPTTTPPEAVTEPASPAPLLAVPSGPTVAVGDEGRLYRGTVRAAADGGGLQLMNELDVEEYLQGMGEVIDPNWPAAALQAQAIVARTYALQTLAAGRDLCSSQQCQVYLGLSAEYSAMSRAVAATRGQVLLYRGALAEAVYSANGGGISASPEEGFGHNDADYPYLKVVTYPTQNPDPWEVRMGLDQLARRIGYPGTASDVTVTRTGPSGRALEVTVAGDAGPQAVEGRRFAEVLSLRSTLFQLRLEGGESAGAPGVPNAARAGRARPRHAPLVLAAGDAGSPLGRAPWAALGVLLLAAWGTAAVRYRSRTTSEGS